MSAQDWIPVVFTKKQTPIVAKNKVSPINPLEKYDGEGSAPKKEFVSKEDQQKITQLRLLKKLTQTELTQKLCLPKDTIKRIENGTHEKNKALTNKIIMNLSR